MRDLTSRWISVSAIAISAVSFALSIYRPTPPRPPPPRLSNPDRDRSVCNMDNEGQFIAFPNDRATSKLCWCSTDEDGRLPYAWRNIQNGHAGNSLATSCPE